MLLHTSILDIIKREVELKTWLIYSPLIVFLYFDLFKINILIFIYSFIIIILLSYLLYKFSLLGGADVMALLLLGLGNSYVEPLFFPKLSKLGMEPMIVLFYSSIYVLALGIYNFMKNYKHTSNMPFSLRIILSFNGKRMKVKDFLNSKFYFPLTIVNENSRELRTSFSIDEDDSEWRRIYSELVKKGILREDEYIWVSWGVPILPFILLGYITSLFIGLPLE
jgi:preflagellin peptidase FlaK